MSHLTSTIHYLPPCHHCAGGSQTCIPGAGLLTGSSPRADGVLNISSWVKHGHLRRAVPSMTHWFSPNTFLSLHVPHICLDVCLSWSLLPHLSCKQPSTYSSPYRSLQDSAPGSQSSWNFPMLISCWVNFLLPSLMSPANQNDSTRMRSLQELFTWLWICWHFELLEGEVEFLHSLWF